LGTTSLEQYVWSKKNWQRKSLTVLMS
jgi:hypothetical protein